MELWQEKFMIYYDVFLGSGFTFIDLKVRHWMEAREVLHQ